MLTIPETEAFISEQVNLLTQQDAREQKDQETAQYIPAVYRPADTQSQALIYRAKWSAEAEKLCAVINMSNPREYLSVFLMYTRHASRQIQNPDERHKFIALMAAMLHSKLHTWAERHGGWQEAYAHWEIELADTEAFLQHIATRVKSLDDAVSCQLSEQDLPTISIAKIIKLLLTKKTTAEAFLTMLSDMKTDHDIDQGIQHIRKVAMAQGKLSNEDKIHHCLTLMGLYCQATTQLYDERTINSFKQKIAAELHQLYYHDMKIEERNGWLATFSRKTLTQEIDSFIHQLYKSLLQIINTDVAPKKRTLN